MGNKMELDIKYKIGWENQNIFTTAIEHLICSALMDDIDKNFDGVKYYKGAPFTSVKKDDDEGFRHIDRSGVFIRPEPEHHKWIVKEVSLNQYIAKKNELNEPLTYLNYLIDYIDIFCDFRNLALNDSLHKPHINLLKRLLENKDCKNFYYDLKFLFDCADDYMEGTIYDREVFYINAVKKHIVDIQELYKNNMVDMLKDAILKFGYIGASAYYLSVNPHCKS